MASPRVIKWFFGEEPRSSARRRRVSVSRLAAAVESASAASTLPAEVLAAILASLWRMDHLAPRLAHVSKTFAAANVMAAIDVADVDAIDRYRVELEARAGGRVLVPCPGSEACRGNAWAAVWKLTAYTNSLHTD